MERLAPKRPGRRIAAILAIVVVIAVVIGIVLVTSKSPSLTPPAAASARVSVTGATTVERRNLVETDTESGTISYAGSEVVYNRLSGTITWLPSVGQLIKAGQVLFRVDNEPVLLMNGSTPAYRTLDSSDSDGPDILELNAELVELGYDPDGIVVDDEWQPATTAGIDRLQYDWGETETGELTLGRVVFLPGAQLVAAVDGTVGSTGGGDGANTPTALEDPSPHAEFVSLTTATTTTPYTIPTTAATTTTPATTTPTTPTTTTPGTSTGAPPPGKGRSAKGQPKSTGKQPPGAHTHQPPANSSGQPSTEQQIQTLLALLKAETASLAKQEATSPKGASTTPGTSTTPTGTSTTPTGTSTTPTGTSTTPNTSTTPASSSNPGSGASATELLQTTSDRLVVTVDLAATSQSEAKVGEDVTVEMPDGSTVNGRITGVSSVAQSSSSSAADQGNGSSSTETIPVTIRLTQRVRGAGLDQAAVSVNFSQARANHVLSVPVTALLATGGDSYAVQEAAAPHELIRVTTGLFAAGYVQISGSGIHPGLQVTDSQG
jgi:hypothetical protein